ncbi:hypothetical protein [Streptosporangium sp. NPDC000509]|uniref:hypothetical protein n=1 Tax=Streptosporangium sp. NPDC000509 TaxID=3366186 RepID=UPI0036B1D78C
MSDPSLGQPGALGEIFGKPATNLLGDKLKPHPAVSSQSQPAPPAVTSAADRQRSQPPPAAPETVISERLPPAQVVASDEDTFPANVYLLPAAITAAAKRRRDTGADNARIVFDAVDAMRDRLADLVAARQTGPGRAEGSLFPTRRGESSQATATRTGRRRLWSFQATEAELKVIDDLWEQAGARSRSELLSCVLEEYLTPPRRRGKAR